MKQEYDNFELITWINRNIHSDRDRIIIYERFVNGLTFSELSDKMYLSERQLKRIVKKLDPYLIGLLDKQSP